MARVLLVEDERAFLHALSYNLRKEGHEVITATDGARALELARSHRPDVVVLDVMLPGKSGLDVCRELRAETSVPILMLTARSEEMDRVLGLELGADDYIVKPVGLRELLARIRAAIRRARMPTPADAPVEILERGALRMDASRREASWRGRELALKPREFDLLLHMARHEGQVLSRDALLTAVWGYEYVGDPRTVDVHIRWLREKLEEDPGDPRHIQTVRGNGYKLRLS